MSAETLPQPATRLTEAQIATIINLVRRAAKTEILPRFRKLTEGQISQKSGPADLVTAADQAAEAMIARGLLRAFPNATVLGEEAAAVNSSLRNTAAEAELAFIVDPVDGTWNFAHGLPLFGVILSVARFGKPVFGMLYDPMTDDWITADEDGPALQSEVAQAPRRLATAAGGGLADLSGIAHLSLLPKHQQAALAPLIPDFARVGALRCSCHEYRLLAQGALDFVLSGTLNPWDHAAGALICRQAGGVARFLDGRDYDIAVTEGHLLCAGSEDTWRAVHDKIATALGT